MKLRSQDEQRLLQDEILRLNLQRRANFELSFATLMGDGFLARHSEFQNLPELLSAGGFVVESADDFVRIQRDRSLDAFVISKTKFKGWDQLFSAALEESFSARK